jgi:large subunit ribosomal protein L9
VKIILTEDVSALGAMGAVVEVARGYARNFLIPQGKAVEATPGNLTRIEQAKSKYAQVKDREREAALVQVAHLQGVSVTIAQRVGEGERLYGSVTASMIAEAMAEKGYVVEKKQIELPEPIKQLGAYEVTVRLAPEVKGQITVEVVAESE